MRFRRFVSFFESFFVTCRCSTGLRGWTNQQGFLNSIENVCSCFLIGFCTLTCVLAMEHGSYLALDLSQGLYANGLFGAQPVVHEISPRVSERM
jgi:hypothetical protein